MSDYAENTMPESYDDDNSGIEKLSQEEILMNESDLLRGLIEAGQEKNNKDSYEKIQIRRSGELKFEFRIRPLSEKETLRCRERATKYAPRKKNQPKIEIDFDAARFRSYLIYNATVDEDRAKLWDNKAAQEALDVLEAIEMIDMVLLAGEKDAVIDRISEISGYGVDLEETAKN